MANGVSPFLLALIALIITTIFAVSWERSEIHRYPTLSAVIILLVTGFGLSSWRRFLDHYGHRTAQHLPVSMSTEDGNDNEDGKDAEGKPSIGRYEPVLPPEPRLRRQMFFAIVIMIIVRALVWIHMEAVSQCKRPGLERIILPLLLFTYDFAVLQRYWTVEKEDNDMSNSVFDDLYSWLCYSPSRYLAPTLFFSLGIFMTVSMSYGSTYICSSTGSLIPVWAIQIFASFLDAALIRTIYSVQVDSHKEQRRSSLFSTVCVLSGVLLAVLGLLYLVIVHQSGKAIAIHSGYLWSLLIAGVCCTVLIACLDQLIHELRPLNMVMMFVFCGTFTRLVLSSRVSRDMFPPHSKWTNAFGLLALYVGFILNISFYKNTEIKKNFATKIPLWFFIVVGIAFFISECYYSTAPRYVGFSPINYLMYENRIFADRWIKQASKSGSLKDAVESYRQRYERSPPPHFDKWFEFATERNAYIIDDYDQIEKLIVPFWGVEPEEIRRMTVIQDPNQEFAGVTVRNSVVEVEPNLTGDAAWVTETAEMIKTFSQWLPDLNIGFNILDTPQVAVPYQMIEFLSRQGREASKRTISAKNAFSPEFHTPWSEWNPEFPSPSSHQSQYTLSDIYNDVFALTCPSNSKARKGRLWQNRDFCIKCARPHAIGPYVQNWTIASDLCHQPDMAALHSYLSSSMKRPPSRAPYQSLIPIFSRQTIHGFNDIVFPGPDTYLSNTRSLASRVAGYDAETYNDTIPFTSKIDALFWRGPLDNPGTSSSSWKGTQSNRLAHTINNSTAPITLLLPAPERLTYKSIPAALVRSLVSTDVAITNPNPTLCTGTCPSQLLELGSSAPVSPTTWYQHRYLFSLDQPSPSATPTTNPTFLQLLASNSLPFHASIFRTWYSDRIHPWLHFIPIDIRYQGIWATLAYFTGLGKNGESVDVGGRSVRIGGKEDQAMFIARTGREWVERTVRREDAEVYMFRLLLEWGRIVDDNRENVGFSLESGSNST